MIRVSHCSSIFLYRRPGAFSCLQPISHAVFRSFPKLESRDTSSFRAKPHDVNSSEENERIRQIIARRREKFPTPHAMIGSPPNGCIDELDLHIAASKGNYLAQEELHLGKFRYPQGPNH